MKFYIVIMGLTILAACLAYPLYNKQWKPMAAEPSESEEAREDLLKSNKDKTVWDTSFVTLNHVVSSKTLTLVRPR